MRLIINAMSCKISSMGGAIVNDTFLTDMGQRLALRRKQLRMTQEEIANKADLTVQVVSNSELGKTALRPENMLKLCEALEISADYLLTGEISGKDTDMINRKVGELTPRQFQFLEEMIRNFLDLCEEGMV